RDGPSRPIDRCVEGPRGDLPVARDGLQECITLTGREPAGRAASLAATLYARSSRLDHRAGAGAQGAGRLSGAVIVKDGSLLSAISFAVPRPTSIGFSVALSQQSLPFDCRSSSRWR